MHFSSQEANRDEMDAKVAFLHRCPLFEGVPESERLRLAHNLIRKEFKANRRALSSCWRGAWDCSSSVSLPFLWRFSVIPPCHLFFLCFFAVPRC